MKEKSKKLIVLVGNIGSGKSTLAKKYVKKGYVCLCRDALRYMIGAGDYIFNPDRTEHLIRRMERVMLTVMMQGGFDIIVDEVGITKKLREVYLSRAHSMGYETTAHVMPRLSKKVSIKRRLQNDHGGQGKEIWGDVWEKFDTAYEPPTKKEGFKEIIKEE